MTQCREAWRPDRSDRGEGGGAMARLKVASLLCGGLMSALLPAAASAQQASGIAGAVKDPSGAVLPGVTVEATSSALIEKVRTVVTDNQGQYKIVDLVPG